MVMMVTMLLWPKALTKQIRVVMVPRRVREEPKTGNWIYSDGAMPLNTSPLLLSAYLWWEKYSAYCVVVVYRWCILLLCSIFCRIEIGYSCNTFCGYNISAWLVAKTRSESGIYIDKHERQQHDQKCWQNNGRQRWRAWKMVPGSAYTLSLLSSLPILFIAAVLSAKHRLLSNALC